MPLLLVLCCAVLCCTARLVLVSVTDHFWPRDRYNDITKHAMLCHARHTAGANVTLFRFLCLSCLTAHGKVILPTRSCTATVDVPFVVCTRWCPASYPILSYHDFEYECRMTVCVLSTSTSLPLYQSVPKGYRVIFIQLCSKML